MNNINNITKNLLENPSLLKECTYQQYLDHFERFETEREAKCPGYEAHHLIPVSLQFNEYNIKNNLKLSREEYCKLPELVDICYRMTPLEHLIAHYLLARESEEGARIFSNMLHFAEFRLPDEDYKIILSLQELAELRSKGYRKASSKLKGKTMKEITGNPDWVNPAKGGKKPWLSNRERTPKEAALLNSMHEKTKGSKWFNNGVEERLAKECPEGFIPGRLTKGRKTGRAPTKGLKWFNNGVVNIVARECPKGFIPGAIHQPQKPREEGWINPLKGQKHFTDGIHNYVGEGCPEGYHPGWTTTATPQSTKDKHRYTDGVHNIWAFECPEGFVAGWTMSDEQLLKNFKWFNNGIKNIRSLECPEGYKPGRLKGTYSTQTASGLKWFNNGSTRVMAKECPEGYKPGWKI